MMIHISRSGSTLGVFDEARVREGLRTGEFIETDLGWTEGMPTWRPLSELSTFGATPPPVTGAASPAGETAPLATTVPVEEPTAATAATGLPWEDRDRLGFVSAWMQTVGMVLTKPVEAFSVMKREGGFGEPLLYAVIGGTLGGAANLLFSLMFSSMGVMSGNNGFGALIGGGVASLFMIILVPLIVVLMMFVTAALFHICLMIVGGANAPFESTFRVLCYGSGSANVLQLVPFCGGMIAGVWGLVLYCIGLARVHQTDTWRVVLAIFLPLLLCCGLAFIVALMVPAMTGAFNR